MLASRGAGIFLKVSTGSDTRKISLVHVQGVAQAKKAKLSAALIPRFLTPPKTQNNHSRQSPGRIICTFCRHGGTWDEKSLRRGAAQHISFQRQVGLGVALLRQCIR